MALFSPIKLIILGIICVGLAIFYQQVSRIPELPPVEEKWWGKIEEKSDSDSDKIISFRIDVPSAKINQLKRRLKESEILPEDLQNSGVNYGMRSKFMKTVLNHWLTNYDWRQWEAKLNRFSHFKTKINGILVHFIHAKPKSTKKKVLPILITHGWPGSVFEFYKLIPLLTESTSKDYDFEVICPSIPGYAWSESPHQEGFNPAEAAHIFHKLMTRLGHKSYFCQGGDWGAFISKTLAKFYPKHVIGVHLNMFTPLQSVPSFLKQAIGGVFPSLVGVDPVKDKGKFYPMFNTFLMLLQESGYFHLQATKPHTIGIALGDSPLGLATYLLEKYALWTNMSAKIEDDAGLLSSPISLDEALTNVMIYWSTSSIGSSMRFYKEFVNSADILLISRIPVKSPVGIIAPPNDIVSFPRSLCESHYPNMLSYTDIERGGHFLALEEPEVLAKDIIKFVYLALKQIK